ncbi:MAG: hypothetical protein ACLRSW_09900 [Christensenellaceae bacterium]
MLILSNRHYEIKEVLEMVKSLSGGESFPCCLYGWRSSFFPLSAS